MLALLLAAGCTGQSREQIARIKTIGVQIAANEQPAVSRPIAAAPLSLDQLVQRAQQRSPEALRSELRGLSDEADFDQQASTGLPRIGIDAGYGRAAFLRRNEPEGLLRVSPDLQWDVARMLQMGRTKRLRVRSKEASGLQHQLAFEQTELEVARRYAEFEAARAGVTLAGLRLASAGRAARISELQGGPDEKAAETLANAASLAGQLRQAEGRAELARARLASLCALRPEDKIMPFAEPAETSEPLPLGQYLELVLAKSEGMKLEEVRTALSAERARLTEAGRWSMFRLSSSAGDLLQSLSGSPFAFLSWTYALLDQGDFNRQLVKARAETLLSRLDRQEEADRLLDTGGRVWLALLDAALERGKAEAALRQAKLAHRIAAAQVADKVVPPQLEQSAGLALASAETEVRLRALEHMIVQTQYRVLGVITPGERSLREIFIGREWRWFALRSRYGRALRRRRRRFRRRVRRAGNRPSHASDGNPHRDISRQRRIWRSG
nr:TolC family protein [uncultured Sphingosinicella sp.]